MAELLVCVPGEPDRRIALAGAPLVVGRADDCDVQIIDKRASKRHLTLEAVEGAEGTTWVVVDLLSSNGTFVLGRDGTETRVLRRALADGEVVRVGDVAMTFRTRPPAATGIATAPVAVVLSGSLVAEPATAPDSAAPVPAPSRGSAGAGPSEGGASSSPAAPAAPALPSPRVGADALRADLAGRRVVTRGAVVLGVAVLVLVAVEVFVSRVGADRARLRAEADAYDTLLATRDDAWERWGPRYEAFVSDFPRSSRRHDVESLAAAKQGVAKRLADAQEELLLIHRNAAGRSESEILGRLLALRQRLGEGTPLDPMIKAALLDAARRRSDAVARDMAATVADADRALARGDASAALRRLAAFEAEHPALHPDEAAKVKAKRGEVLSAAAALANRALESAAAVADLDTRRSVLLAAIAGLAGTPEVERLRAAVVSTAGGAPGLASSSAGSPGSPGSAPRPPSGASPGPTTPPTPAAAAALAERVASAEAAVRERRWRTASRSYGALAAAPESPARRKAEWAERAADLGKVAALADELAAAVAAGPVRVRLEGGVCEVRAVDEEGVRWKRGEVETTSPWAGFSPGDLLALLEAAGPNGKAPLPDRSLALALLAAELADRAAAVRHLLPLVEVASHRDEAFRVMARRVDGRSSVPDGGYAALGGELLDRTEFARRTEAARVASLREEAARIVETVAKHPAFKALEKLRARRDELDRRRARALLAIFNETHWPYPHDDRATARQYELVTEEVQRRWKAVAEVWDEPVKVAAPKAEALAAAVARHAAIVDELRRKGQEAATVAAAMEPYALYVGAGTLTIRTYFRTAEERDLLAYNRWVTTVYNPTKTAVATEVEREQIRITNEYRVMMGWAFRVLPPPVPYASLDAKDVEAALDRGTELSRTALRAVRIDDTLVAAARAHSMDMSARGYFSHFAPPNPATGQPGTSPFDRMKAAGYRGQGMSENIARARGPMEAHLMWLRSSGHHRNILSEWDDLGVGYAGSYTQNFGSGGGSPPVLPGTVRPPRDPDEAGDEGGGEDGGEGSDGGDADGLGIR